jgi:hypothetical protein
VKEINGCAITTFFNFEKWLDLLAFIGSQ